MQRKRFFDAFSEQECKQGKEESSQSGKIAADSETNAQNSATQPGAAVHSDTVLIPCFEDASSCPHIAQVNQHAAECNKPGNKQCGSWVCLAMRFPFQRRIDGSSPRMPYRRRNQEKKYVIHWGQCKLLISEIEFLTQ